ncbi:hypothetical protein HK100_001679 [Physocladia obscura]|uniref:Heterokaryon incompatibility domain-containing protein n=1 Tax=Physocladia obscura TaxID=109957 RepID=A0AAD5XLJ3_9FUNG|nr:hypothetical protein HK100_001679 [Physocladia obscura]
MGWGEKFFNVALKARKQRDVVGNESSDPNAVHTKFMVFSASKNDGVHMKIVDQKLSGQKIGTVSHVWQATQDLTLFGRRVPVNPVQKIHHIALIAEVSKLPIWVDFLSIDQDSQEDKEYHVQRMDAIYENAARTFIILDADDFAIYTNAQDKITIFLKAVKTKLEKDSFNKSKKGFEWWDTTLDKLVSDVRIAINQCRNMSYNKRVWTLQERCLAKHAVYTHVEMTKQEIAQAESQNLQAKKLYHLVIDNSPSDPPQTLLFCVHAMDRILHRVGARSGSVFDLRQSFEDDRASYYDADQIYGRLAIHHLKVEVNYISDKEHDIKRVRDFMHGLVLAGALPVGLRVARPQTCDCHEDISVLESWLPNVCMRHFSQAIKRYVHLMPTSAHSQHQHPVAVEYGTGILFAPNAPPNQRRALKFQNVGRNSIRIIVSYHENLHNVVIGTDELDITQNTDRLVSGWLASFLKRISPEITQRYSEHNCGDKVSEEAISMLSLKLAGLYAPQLHEFSLVVIFTGNSVFLALLPITQFEKNGQMLFDEICNADGNDSIDLGLFVCQDDCIFVSRVSHEHAKAIGFFHLVSEYVLSEVKIESSFVINTEN